MQVAAEVFSIRYVCGFGEKLPDGVVPFDDLFTVERSSIRFRRSSANGKSIPAAHVAVITFDTGENGIVPVARNHLEMLAGGLGVTARKPASARTPASCPPWRLRRSPASA